MELISKKELLKEFEVEASFYNVKIGNKIFECRNQAKIKRIGFSTNNNDSIFILCNPGSCDPRKKELVSVLDPRREAVPFIKANSDQTQEQIMRLMKIMQWNQISIINLSDLCSGNLTDFKNKLVYVNDRSLFYHSIFSKERENELQELLIYNPDVELIAGWGTDPFIKNMAENVFQHRLINDIKGWKHKTYPFYYHPNPRIYDNKKEWIVRTLQSIGVKFS